MNISAINKSTPAFSGKYQVNINQKMQNGEACLERDLMLGVWLNKVNNYEQISNQIHTFFQGDYKKDENAPCNVIYDIPNYEDTYFETCMNKIGQKFNKVT